MTDKAQKLKPCPFCGGKACVKNLGVDIETKKTCWQVGCFNDVCPIVSPFFVEGYGKISTINAWNRRA